MVGDSFLSAMKAYPDLPGDANVEAWLVTIAHRKAIDVTRAAARRAPYPSPRPPTPRPRTPRLVPPPALTATSPMSPSPAQQKQAVAYHYLAGLPYADVADIVGGSANAVRRPQPTASPPSGAPIRAPPQRKESPMNADDLARDLARAFPDAPGELRRLHDRLAASAERDGILDVAYRTVDSPVGPLLLAATKAGPGPGRLRQRRPQHRPAGPGRPDQPRILDTPARLDAPARELDEYFAGRRRSLSTCRWTGGFRPDSGAPC